MDIKNEIKKADEGIQVEKNGNILYTSRQLFGNTISMRRVDDFSYEFLGNLPPEGERIKEDWQNDKTAVDLLMKFLEEELQKHPAQPIQLTIGKHRITCNDCDEALRIIIEGAIKNPHLNRDEKMKRAFQNNPYEEFFR